MALRSEIPGREGRSAVACGLRKTGKLIKGVGMTSDCMLKGPQVSSASGLNAIRLNKSRQRAMLKKFHTDQDLGNYSKIGLALPRPTDYLVRLVSM